MKLAGISDVGKHRPNNEDNFAFGELEGAAFGIVCDGMGGAEGGEIASKIAVDTIRKKLELAYSPKMSAAAIERMLCAAITAANYEIYSYAQSHDLMGMGTTVAAAVIKDGCAVIAYDGDSRVYMLAGDIRQLTTDHTFLNELYKIGQITLEEMQTDPRKNIITRALGVSEEIDVDIVIEDIDAGDVILLCSDGLTNCLTDAQIMDIYHSTAWEDTCDKLINQANDNGGMDNITAVLMQYEEA